MDTLQNGRGVVVRLRAILPFQPTRPRQNLRARNIERTLLSLRQIGQDSDPVIKFFAFNGPEIILPLPQKTCSSYRRLALSRSGLPDRKRAGAAARRCNSINDASRSEALRALRTTSLARRNASAVSLSSSAAHAAITAAKYNQKMISRADNLITARLRPAVLP